MVLSFNIQIFKVLLIITAVLCWFCTINEYDDDDDIKSPVYRKYTIKVFNIFGWAFDNQ